MPVLVSPPSPLFWVRVAALLFSCVAFSVQKKGGFLPNGSVSDWCMFCWVFSFSCTLVVLLVELCRIQTWIPVSWKNVPITVACYAALFCLSASIIFLLFFLRNKRYLNSKIQVYCIISALFSCLATAAYMGEVTLSKARPGEEAGYMATAPGLIKVCQTSVACVIFILVRIHASNNEYLPPPLQWCMAVYCICFLVSMAVVMMFVGGCTDCLPNLFPKLLSAQGFLGVAMYMSATILWPMFKFIDEQEKERSKSSSKTPVAVLTGLNLLLYIADLAYSTKVVFISYESDV